MTASERLRKLDDRVVGNEGPMSVRAAALVALLFSAVSLALVWGDVAATVLLIASIAALSSALWRDRARG
jgi:hypothetical protein